MPAFKVRRYHALASYEFLAGIAKLYHPDETSLLDTVDRVRLALPMFKVSRVYRHFEQLEHDLRYCDVTVVLCTDLAGLADVITELDNSPQIRQIVTNYFTDLHSLILGNQQNRLGQYAKGYRDAVKQVLYSKDFIV